MKAIMSMAHEVRRSAATTYGGKPGDYVLSIALEMAWTAHRSVKENNTMKTTMTISGKTYESRDVLKKSGWRYDGSSKSWTKTVDIPEAFLGLPESPESRAFAKEHKGNRKGCIVTANNGCTVLWVSKEYFNSTNHETMDRAQANDDRTWHGVNGAPSKNDLRDDPDFL